MWHHTYNRTGQGTAQETRTQRTSEANRCQLITFILINIFILLIFPLDIV
jgi:hypothetical protein